jgi:hypothetical protein
MTYCRFDDAVKIINKGRMNSEEITEKFSAFFSLKKERMYHTTQQQSSQRF